MSTIQKHDSENQIPNTQAADDPIKSDQPKAADQPKADTPADELKAADQLKTADELKSGDQPKADDQPNPAVARTNDLLAAWRDRRFAEGGAAEGDVDAALAEFFTDDFVLDASSASYSAVEAYRVHHGHAGLKDWFAFEACFELEGVEISHGASGSAPSEVWMLSSAVRAVCKATGKSAPFRSLQVLEWDGSKAVKMTVAVYNPAAIAAIMSAREPPFPFASPVQLPAFEPHPDPTVPFAKLMALWGAGELRKPDVRAKHLASDCVDDLTDIALAAGPLSDVFKPHHGVDGAGEWIEHQATHWAMSNVDVQPIAGLKPGCVVARLTFDVKHTGTVREAKGVQMFNEFAYNAEGQFVHATHFCMNAPLLASIY